MGGEKVKITLLGHPLIHIRQWSLGVELARRGHDVQVICPEAWHDEAFELGESEKNLPGYRRVGVALTGKPNIYEYSLNCLGHLKEFEPDIIYSMSEPWSVMSGRSLRLARHLGCKLAIFTWENLYKVFPSPFGEIESKVLGGADLLVAGNQGAKEVMVKKGADASRVEVVPQTGVNLELFHPMDLPKSYDLCFAGRFVEEKGIRLIEQVVEDLNLRILWVGGRGPRTPRIGDVKPWQRYEDLPQYYNRADAFIQAPYRTPHWAEQWGYASLEAMACGLPVISTETGAVPEVLDECALLVGERNPEQLREAVHALLGSPELKENLSREGRRYVGENFSLEAIAGRVAKCFEAVAK